MTNNLHSMRNLAITFVLAGFLMISCDDSSTGVQPKPPESKIKTYTVNDLNAANERGAPPDYVFYSLSQNKTVPAADSASAAWDIAFSGSSIIVNNTTSGPGHAGAVVLDIPFDQVSIAPSKGYQTDTDTSQAITYSDWGHYTGSSKPAHAILAKDDATIVVKTADGRHYAKIKITSWYRGNPDVTSETFINLNTRAQGGYYTFKYAIQENGSRSFN